jgi:hypothetical protein
MSALTQRFAGGGRGDYLTGRAHLGKMGHSERIGAGLYQNVPATMTCGYSIPLYCIFRKTVMTTKQKGSSN